MVSKPSTSFPGFDRLFCIRSSGGSREFIAGLDLGDADPLAVTRGTAEVTHARGRWAMGSAKPAEIVWTTSVFPVLLSPALVDALRRAGISGWASYPVELRGKKGVELGTYHGLVIRGRCGPIDKSRSSIAPSTSPTGPGWVVKGLFFDERSWDGSDIFMPEDKTAFVFFTEKAKDLLGARGRGLDIKVLTDWTIPTYAWSV